MTPQQQLVLDAGTAGDFRVALGALRADLEKLARMTESYPVICVIAGRRWVFESKQDIRNLIAQIESALGNYDRAA